MLSGWTPALRLLREAGAKWKRDRADVLAASLAYYSVFALAPLVMLGVAVLSLRSETSESRRFMLDLFGMFVGERGAEAIRPMVESAGKLRHGAWAAFSVATLVYGASSLFVHLQDSLNHIWNAPPRGRHWIVRFLRRRLLSFALVLLVPALLVLGPALSAALSSFGHPQGGGIVLSLLLETLVFAFIFKFLPDVPVPWADVWVGALFTASLFTLGQTLLGVYLNRIAARSVYGAAGSLVALLVWVHVSAQILLFGAEFIQVYKGTRESRRQPPAPPSALPPKEP